MIVTPSFPRRREPGVVPFTPLDPRVRGGDGVQGTAQKINLGPGLRREDNVRC